MAASAAVRRCAPPRRAPRWLLACALFGAGAGAGQAQTLEEKIGACAACHGQNGQSPNPDVPSIGGQPKLFVMYQLFFYREGRRKSAEMNAIAAGLSDAELGALADYVARLPPPAPLADAGTRPRLERAEVLATQRLCGSCHNRDYSGREQMPRVAGQREGYLFKALKDYQSGARVGTQAAMAEAVRGLNDGELADLAYYLARFRP